MKLKKKVFRVSKAKLRKIRDKNEWGLVLKREKRLMEEKRKKKKRIQQMELEKKKKDEEKQKRKIKRQKKEEKRLWKLAREEYFFRSEGWHEMCKKEKEVTKKLQIKYIIEFKEYKKYCSVVSSITTQPISFIEFLRNAKGKKI